VFTFERPRRARPANIRGHFTRLTEPAIQNVTGKTLGLKPQQLKRLEATFKRRVRPREVATPELARHLTELSRETGRQLGVLINRRGEVEHVVVGDAFKLELPDVGRARAAEGRLRGLRLVHTHLKDEPLTRDDLTDLALLRLDLVCAVQARADGLPGQVHVGMLAPDSSDAERASDSAPPWRTQSFPGFYEVDLDPLALVEEIEAGFARVVRARAVAKEGRAVLVGVALHGRTEAESSMAELRELARTAGVDVLEEVVQPRRDLDGRYVVGEGKLDELNLRAMQLVADMLVFDHDLTPSQARHLAERTSLKVIDRTQLILDIFAQRAQSADGKLQVELAQLQYMLPRLSQRDEGLSRLMGGIGGRGPGETKLEVDRRRVRDRIAMLQRRIDQLSGERAMRRQKRDRGGVPVIAIVGYTNAGKSTLLNALTASEVLAEDKLFATLDPTSRRLRFPREREVVLTDTVGFIRQLPKTLVNAFRATLEELSDADLLLHVVDASDPEQGRHIEAVEGILSSLGLSATPRLVVFNKGDRLPGGVDGDAAVTLALSRGGLCVSAATREGFAPLLAEAEELLWRDGKVAPAHGGPFEAGLAHRPAARFVDGGAA
jgi:GTP-binding protein HflX